MNIAVYCASAEGNSPEILRFAYEAGRQIAAHGHTLVYGGSTGGLMGAVADGALEGGGRVIGVEPDIPLIREHQHPGITEVIFSRSMAERRSKMIELSDGFIALPGGTGTLDEISEVICLKSLGKIRGGVVLADVCSFWQPFVQMCAHMENTGFLYAPLQKQTFVSGDIHAILAHLENALGE